MGFGCKKCTKMGGIIFLVVGVLYLLADWNVGGWNFWNISWWTAVFLIVGLAKIGMASCKDCQACNMPAASGKKK